MAEGPGAPGGTSGAPIRTGQRIGSYRILRLIGQGGMGEVYEAIHHYIERRAAVKVLHSDLSLNPQFAGRFLNEARAVNLIKHPGLVEIYEFGVLDDGTAYIVMEFLEGELLATIMQRSPAGMAMEALLICRQIAQAMTAAHHKGIIHRGLQIMSRPAERLVKWRPGNDEGTKSAKILYRLGPAAQKLP
jgi:serine/threonine protein kinase